MNQDLQFNINEIVEVSYTMPKEEFEESQAILAAVRPDEDWNNGQTAKMLILLGGVELALESNSSQKVLEEIGKPKIPENLTGYTIDDAGVRRGWLGLMRNRATILYKDDNNSLIAYLGYVFLSRVRNGLQMPTNEVIGQVLAGRLTPSLTLN